MDVLVFLHYTVISMIYRNHSWNKTLNLLYCPSSFRPYSREQSRVDESCKHSHSHQIDFYIRVVLSDGFIKLG